ncbi:hypothetical protein MMC08_005422 [Hypocenomyce scalaris]|nr:hypothetical protein [Hypocenomyce scalaris]
MAYDSNMPVGRGPPRNHYGRSDHAVREDYEDRQGSRRSLEGRRYRGDDGYGSPRDPYAGFNGSRKPARMSIEDAIGRLFNTLTAALDFYINFKRDFEGETRSIRAYAGSDLLENLWARRAKSIEGRNGGNQKSNMPGDDQYDQDRPPPDTNFKAMYRELSESFGVAATATPNSNSRSRKTSHGSSIDLASLDRLMKKLHDAYKEIKVLSASASKRSGDIQALITETELVLAYLDKSRDLWNPHGANGPSDGQDFQDPGGQGGGDPDGFQEAEPGG